MRPVYEYSRRGQRPRAARLLQDPAEYRLYRFLGETVPDIIAHGGEVRQFLAQCIGSTD